MQIIPRTIFLTTVFAALLSGALQGQPAPPGSLDTSFAPALNSNALVYAVALQTNGQILIGGSFTSIGVVGVTNLARLNPDGTLDAGFNPGRAMDRGYVDTIAVQPDGKVLAGGSFISSDFSSPVNFSRLNTNGTVDTSFYSGLFVDSAVNAVLVQPDGGILIAGSFGTVGGYVRRNLARLLPNGTVDSTFDACIASSAGAGATGLAIQPDNYILASGQFGFNNGAYRQGIARLSACGTLDTNYSIPPGINPDATAFTVTLPSGGYPFLGGNFTNYNGTNITGIVQLDSEGLASPGFRPVNGINFGGTNFVIAVQPDGKIIIGGEFTTWDATSRHRLARISPNGSLDPQFDPGAGPDNSISSMVIQGDGKIVVGGKFTSFAGSPRNGLARLNGDQPASKLSQPALLGNGQFRMVFSGVAQVHYGLQASTNLSDWTVILSFTGLAHPTMLSDPAAPSYPRRFYRAVSLP